MVTNGVCIVFLHNIVFYRRLDKFSSVIVMCGGKG